MFYCERDRSTQVGFLNCLAILCVFNKLDFSVLVVFEHLGEAGLLISWTFSTSCFANYALVSDLTL